ncbi:MAG: VOC family protein [Anaerolineaceae bacterium]|nr:VOC family protein [Anaerolineaceae bacterium]
MENNKTLISGIHHISMKTNTWDESMRFYGDVLGFAPGAKNEAGSNRMQLLNAGRQVYIELTEMTEARADQTDLNPPHFAHLALRVTDTAGLMKKVRAAGYEITLDTKTIHSGDLHAIIGFFKGPQGELIEAFQEIDSAGMDAGK